MTLAPPVPTADELQEQPAEAEQYTDADELNPDVVHGYPPMSPNTFMMMARNSSIGPENVVSVAARYAHTRV
jgi:hypothetical protein